MNTNSFKYSILKCAISACLVLLTASASAQSSSDSVYQDSATGEWVFTVTNPENASEVKLWRYAPRNQFLPRMGQEIRLAGNNQLAYSYRLSNSAKSKQAISYLWIDGSDMYVPELDINYDAYDPNKTSTQLMRLTELRGRELRTLTDKFTQSPKGWVASIRLDTKTKRGTFFGWFPRPPLGGDSLPPGKVLKGAAITRPELPGVGLAQMQGDSHTPGRAVGVPGSGPLAEAWDQIEAADTLKVPVLVPAVPLSQPYSVATHAQELKKELASWVSISVLKQPVADDLKQQMDQLIAAATQNNKPGVRQAVTSMLTLALGHHPGMTHRHFEEDDEAEETQALPIKPIKWYGARSTQPIENNAPQPDMHRIAVRALGFNLMYLLTRSEIGK